MTDVVIAGAARTPIGAFNGSLATTPAHALGATAIREALIRAGVDAAEVSEVVMGQVLTAAQGQNPARQAARAAGIPWDVTALGVNQVCGSGLRAVLLGRAEILSGDASIVVAGGQENMSAAPHAAPLRDRARMGSVEFVDTMIHDGLWDAFEDHHMGETAELLAERYGITRGEQDAFALESQRKAAAAIAAGRLTAEIAPVVLPGREAHVFSADENPRPNLTIEKLARLRPAFRSNGTITAGNAAAINDGAAAVVLMTGREAERRGVEPLARIVAWAGAGIEPAIMGMAPVPSTRAALAKAGWRMTDVDLIEGNEAFAVQSIAVNRELDLDPDRLNVNGGTIALGHPIGAAGARMLVTLVHEMRRRNARRGLVTLCIGGGMGLSVCLER